MVGDNQIVGHLMEALRFIAVLAARPDRVSASWGLALRHLGGWLEVWTDLAKHHEG